MIAFGLGTGLDHLEVHVRQCATGGDEIDRVHVFDEHHGVRVAHRQVSDWTERVELEGVPAHRLVRRLDGSHLDARPRLVWPGDLDVDATKSSVGRDHQDVLGRALLAQHGLGQTPNAIATHLGARPVGVVEPHLEVARDAADRRTSDDEAVGTDAAGAMAQAHRERARNVVRHGDDVVAQQDEEVVAEPVVLAQVHRVESPSMASAASTRFGVSASSTHLMRGSRRNQRSCRTAN